jgi:Kef-type K+ transport system membrane component KefB
MRPPSFFPFLAVAWTAVPAVAFAATDPRGVDMLPVLSAVLLILVGARLGGALFERLGQSPVLGELLAGVLIGNLGLIGFHAFDGVRELPAIEVLAQFGVLFLLFEVGLESDVRKMLQVGASSFAVAVLGVVAPMVLGFWVSRGFFPDHHPLADWFVGATLCATSVGITARVLTDLKRATSTEGRIILGAAVIDDVLGLIVLAVVAGIIGAAERGRPFEFVTVLAIVGKSVLFLVGVVVVGRWLSPRVFRLATRVRGPGVPVSLALVFCFSAALLAGRAGLAPIVGAFAAGLVVEPVHDQELGERGHGSRDLRELMAPIATFLVPVFFVLMGMRVDLTVFGRAGIMGFALVLTLVAVVGKQVCSLGVFEKGADRLAVGLGMIPRGEVGLIFASIGATLTLAGRRVVTDEVYSAVVAMVALTTLMTPPLLVWRMGGARRAARPAPRLPRGREKT